MARQKKFTLEKQKIFLQKLEATANVHLSAKAAGVAPKTAYKHRKVDSSFSEAWRNAIDSACDLIEAELAKRVTGGEYMPSFYRDKQWKPLRYSSDTNLIILLKTHRRELYDYLTTEQVKQLFCKRGSVNLLRV